MDNQITAKDAIATARAICIRAKLTGMSYEEIKYHVLPLLEIANNRGRQLARKHGKRWVDIKLHGLLR